MKYNTIIFDLDGTLLNTIEDIADSTNFALGKCGFPERTLKEITSFVGNGTDYLMSNAVPSNTPKDKLEECTFIYRNHYITNKNNKTGPYDGILNMLARLKDKNYKLAVVSNKFDSAVKELCGIYFSDYLEVAIGESPEVKRKPAPDTVFAAMEELDSSPFECIYVGDSDVDVKTARNVGIPSIGVSWGLRPRQLLEDEGANYIIDKPDEIHEVLSSL